MPSDYGFQDTISRARSLVEESRYAEASEILTPLAELALPEALGLLGLMAFVGTPPRGMEAVRLFAEAAALGDGPAAHNLGSLYSAGMSDVPRNPHKARAFFDLARRLGCQPAPDAFYENRKASERG